MGEIFAGRYELVDPIAEGGAGSVWRVWDRKERVYRAAKILKQSDSGSILRFIRETGHKIDHPHVLAPLNWAGEDDRVLLTMELAHGGSLATMLADYGGLPDWWAMVVIDQLLDALTVVHGRGLVHRDIKPGNLLLDATGTGLPWIWLADFGIAARAEDPRLTHLSQVVGTPGYMSQLARAGADPAPAQDLYATAAVFSELLTGMRPIEDQPLPVGAASHLAEFVEQLARDSGTGFPSAAAARAALRRITAVTDPESDPIEVFDQIGPLPAGWAADGPIAAGSEDAATEALDRDRPGNAHPATQVQPVPAPTRLDAAAATRFDAPAPAAAPAYPVEEPRSYASGPTPTATTPTATTPGPVDNGLARRSDPNPPAPGGPKNARQNSRIRWWILGTVGLLLISGGIIILVA
ncbi:serine/threonine-protein kinase [Granulicoccus phenolivorans]|uniref:serine/threonine-protein kinase n=1 Tax=Granulicoccus phenolivorans TaxID=266854 RepID=UPI000425E28E|nr:serine/threonine-protein kinase [Granulicoccus phenolivorans]